MTSAFILALIWGAFVCVPVDGAGHFDVPVWARGGKLWKEMGSRSTLGNTTANVYAQLVDHNNPGDGTFSQRFYFDTTYWRNASGAPIFYYIGGEGPLRGTPTGFVTTLALEFGALIVALEHRWYGESLPGDITSTTDLSTTLTVQQALADLAAFQTWFTSTILQTTSAPWLAIGGSYPGALSAWYREVYPEMVVAAWSSSGVVDAVFNFTGFDMQASRMLLESGSDPSHVSIAALSPVSLAADS
jgi:hypothetical protein